MYWAFQNVVVDGARQALPLDWSVPGGDGRLFVEIGFGNGEFLAHLGRTEPRASVVGIEVSQWCVTKAARRIQAEGLTNLRLLWGDARHLLRLCFPPASVDRVILNFPCPWPKKRHASRRVTSPEFAALLARFLKPGGAFHLATDVDWYAASARECFASLSGFAVREERTNPQRAYLTKYERKWKEEGRDTFTLEVEWLGGSVPSPEPWTREEEPIMEGTGRVTLEEALGALKDRQGGRGDHRFVFRESFASPEGEGLLLAITVDEGFEQHFFLRFYPCRGGIGVKPDPTTVPYRTPAVREALKEAAAVLRGV